MNQHGPARGQHNCLCDLLLAENDSQACDIGAVPDALSAPKKDRRKRESTFCGMFSPNSQQIALSGVCYYSNNRSGDSGNRNYYIRSEAA